MKSSSLSRSLELAKLVAKVGLNEWKSGDVKSRIEQAAMIAKTLSSLKGAAMKAGQLLSLDLDNYFPPEAIQILSQLQNAAVAHPFHEIEATLKNELTSAQRKRIKSIGETPIGVASIGQVHKAMLMDQDKQLKDIVIKIQYPGVDQSVESDLKILKLLSTSFCQLTGRKMNLEPLFKELRLVFEQEVDYLTESQFQEKYRLHINRFNKKSEFNFKVPTVEADLTTSKVLIMNYENGESLRSWVNSNPSAQKRQILAQSILDLYFHEFFEWGLVQTDPNWGNFLVNESKDNLSLCLLDFGASRTYTRSFIKNYIILLNLVAENKSKKLKEHAIDFGLMDKRESEEAFEAFQEMLQIAIRPFFVKKSGGKKFDFSDKNHSINSQKAAKALSEVLVYSPPPYSLVFLHRKLAGVYSILKSLEVHLDISSYWDMMKELSEGKSS